MVAVPTTLSAAEFTWFGGALGTGLRVKEAYRYPLMIPQAVILDPAITLATPLSLFLSTDLGSRICAQQVLREHLRFQRREGIELE
jgi:maleylacetate reductase